MTDYRILPDDVVVAMRNHVSATLQDNEVILNLADGIYYGLNPIGAFVWACIQQPIAVRQLQERLLAEFDVDIDRCGRELGELLQDMAVRSLIEISHETDH